MNPTKAEINARIDGLNGQISTLMSEVKRLKSMARNAHTLDDCVVDVKECIGMLLKAAEKYADRDSLLAKSYRMDADSLTRILGMLRAKNFDAKATFLEVRALDTIVREMLSDDTYFWLEDKANPDLEKKFDKGL